MELDPVGQDLTDEQKAELDRRLADDEAAPDDFVPWDEVKERALAQNRDRGPTSSPPSGSDDNLANDLIANNPAFRALVERSQASGREPFPFAEPEE